MQAPIIIITKIRHPTPTPIIIWELFVCPLDALFIEDNPFAIVGLKVVINSCVGVTVGGGVGLKLGVIVGSTPGCAVGGAAFGRCVGEAC